MGTINDINGPFQNAKGDLAVGTGSGLQPAILAASTDGFVLTLDSSQTTGTKWAINSAGITAWTDKSIGFAAVAGNGYFIIGSLTATLPASPSNGDTIVFFIDGSFVLTVQANTGQTIQLATNVSSSAGTVSSTLSGDSLSLVYRSTDTKWCATAWSGAWNKT